MVLVVIAVRVLFCSLLTLQLHKLMVYDPEQHSLSGDALQQFQELWANHGDAISRQYTGTDALKVTASILIQFDLTNIPAKL